MKEYLHRPREKRLKEIIVGQSLVALLILVISSCLVFWGMGYKFNWQTMKIIHTGIVYMTFAPDNVEVAVSGQKPSEVKSVFEAQFLPGYYDVKISKDGYYSWQQHIKVIADQVGWYKNIVLFKTKPEISVISDQNIISSIDSPYDILVKNPEGDLSFNQHEIWLGDDLVTRLSNQISSVIWYPGSEYLAYQQADEIRIIEKNGSNDVLLVKLSSSDKTNFLFSWDGSVLLYRDGAVYKRAVIR
ncbi:hypothetical protein COT12_00420 [Candidatus Berkelbacteria bacterium CG08_land_8_20_14_0_20_39_8]|uniref:PEGA domain-containing protein n=1 Tax=Candidatus Berkelbacteria bacterium CG08_land_8_20_14_0_20_39_8 TaxID=1974511 RepID=A0A2M6YCX5_9BACT|nr:MAG: hypothetical protein COT12_00420 [Candidatus Berkelbacteria bacterium CG08_land_8_20_14_0_20_39_8]